jgi:zinc protease
VEAARRHFGGWRRREDPFAAAPVVASPKLDSMGVVILTGDVTSVTILAQWQGPSVTNDAAATYDADVMADLLADEESGFQQRLVHEGPFQSAHLGYQTLAHTGPISFSATTTVEQLPAALTALSGELFVMQNADYFEPRALASAAKRRRAGRSFEREEGVSLAHALSYAWAVTGIPYHASYADSLAARTPADLERFVKRYVARRPFVIGLLVPPGRDRELVPMMQQFLQMMKEDGR